MSIRSVLVIVLIVAGCGTAGYAAWRAWPAVKQYRQVAVPEQSGSYQFAVVGDNHGVNPIYEQILRDLDEVKPAFVLNVADTSEHGTAEEFQAVRDLEAPHKWPVYHVIGNHDIKTDPTGQLFQQAFGQAPCTGIDVDDLRLVLLNNADRKTGFSDDCLAVAQDQIATAGDRKVFIAYHRPFGLPLGDVLGDDETRASRETNTALQAILAAAKNVAYIFTGHLHTYLPYSLEGIPAVVSGGGGDPAQTAIGGARANNFHWLLVSVQSGRVTVSYRSVQLHD